jgi:hypothetical protein
MPITTDQDYLDEEVRLRGANPTVRATINPDGGFPQEILANEIVHPGKLHFALSRNFQGLSANNHVLAVNNRNAAFIPSATTCPGGAEDLIKIEHGFILPDDSISWLTLFTGKINQVHSSHALKAPHNAIIESSNIIYEKLSTKIGTPATIGTRQPFMHGPYLANAELEETIDPYISTITKTGTGSGSLAVLGIENFSSNIDLNIRVKAESTGEIGTATIKISSDGGQTWDKTGIISQNVTTPITIANQLKIYFIGGLGNDIVADDYWDFTAYAKVHKYIIPGFPFTSIPSVYNNAVEIFTGFTANPTTGIILLTGNSGRLRARVVKDTIIHPVDVIRDILEEIGIDSYINELSFAAAKEDTLNYNIGTRFENITAAKAIQLITQSCLYFFWIDQNEIYLYAYTGNLT